MDLTSPYRNITPETIKAEILADIADKGVDLDLQEGSYTNTLVSSVAYRLYAGYQAAQQLVYAAFPDETSGELIDMAAGSVGLTRKAAERASVLLTFTGEAGTLVPAGTVVYASESGLRYQTTADAMLAEDGATAPAQAADGGAAYNLGPGQINAMHVNVAGITGVTNLQAATGGTDVESDEAFFARYHQKMTLTPTSNNPDQWVLWALEVPGVAHAQCVPAWNGPGTVKVIVAGEGQTQVEPGVLQACQAHLEGQRIIGTQVTVENATRREVDLTGQIVLKAGYTVEGVVEQLTKIVNEMLEHVPFGSETTIPYNRFVASLMQCDGVYDYAEFYVNNTVEPLHIESGEVWGVGIVDIEE